MKSHKSQADPGNNSVEAMERVLRAERDAEAEIARCELAAVALLQEARRHVHQIQQRADKRISRVAQRCAQRLDAQLHTQAQHLTSTETFTTTDPRTLQQLLQRVAEALVGTAEESQR